MIDLIYLLSLGLAFTAVSLACFTTLGSAAERASIQGSLKDLDAYGSVSVIDEELSVPLAERLFGPMLKACTRIGRRITPLGYIDNLKQKIILAGDCSEDGIDKFLSLKGMAFVLGAALFLVWASVSGITPASLLGGSILALTCFFLPDYALSRRVARRRKLIRRALPDTLDLLTISVEAGLGFDAALSKVIKSTEGPLAEELFRFLQEIRLGASRSEAFRSLMARTSVDELDSFILAMLQADVFGISIGKVLRVQAREMRVKRRQLAEEIAMKAPVKIVFPLVLCIFPALMVVILGPAVIQISEFLFRGF